MKNTFTLSTKAWVAITLVVAVLAAVVVSTGQFLLPLVAFCTAGIAAFDSMHIPLRRYRTWLSYGPVGLFVVCTLVWPFAIIWYFVVRVRIARGTMPLRNDFKPIHRANQRGEDASGSGEICAPLGGSSRMGSSLELNCATCLFSCLFWAFRSR